MQTIGLYVDVTNLYSLVKQKYGKKVDYTKLLEKVKGDEILGATHAYGYCRSDSIGFKTCLKHAGYDITFFEIRDNQKRRINYNMWMACDVMSEKEKLDQVYICSSNPEITPIVKHVKPVIVSLNVPKCIERYAEAVVEIDETLLED